MCVKLSNLTSLPCFHSFFQPHRDQSSSLHHISFFYFFFLVIRKCGSTFYVKLAHAAPPTQYKAFMAFSTNWLPEGSTSRYTCKEQQISRPGYIPVIVSIRKVAEQRSIKTAFSYDLFIIIFFFQTKFF